MTQDFVVDSPTIDSEANPLKYFTARFFSAPRGVWKEIVNMAAISETELRMRVDKSYPPETRVVPDGRRLGLAGHANAGQDSLTFELQAARIEVHEFLADGRDSRMRMC